MTAHKPKPTITPERVAWFAAYYKHNRAWGVFHASIEDGNLCEAAGRGFVGREYVDRGHWPTDVREAAEWFDTLTPSQRKRLGQKAEDLANTVMPAGARA